MDIMEKIDTYLGEEVDVKRLKDDLQKALKTFNSVSSSEQLKTSDKMMDNWTKLHWATPRVKFEVGYKEWEEIEKTLEKYYKDRASKATELMRSGR